MPKVTVYSRPGCGLCEEVIEKLQALRREADFDWEEVNIDEDPALRRRYNEDVPVIAIDGEDVFYHRLDSRQFLERLKSSSRG
jgi:glutaredoxin